MHQHCSNSSVLSDQTQETAQDHDHFDVVAVQAIKVGEFVRKLNKDGSMRLQTYQRGHYDRASKTFTLTDCKDINREVYVKAGVQLAIGFTY